MKLATDPAYRTNQAESQETWRENHPDYWQRYRERNPHYAERNRNRQRERRQGGSVAKMDALRRDFVLESGTYFIIPESECVAKMDASARKVRLIPVG